MASVTPVTSSAPIAPPPPAPVVRAADGDTPAAEAAESLQTKLAETLNAGFAPAPKQLVNKFV